MKKILSLFVFTLLLTLNAQAQLPDGATSPDFTVTDINGEVWNLYELLDEGKTVVLDISATWCYPCWTYHDSGALKSIWEDYGPDGTDEMVVLFVEGDDNTTYEQLTGIGENTYGDFVTGTPYPIIEDGSIPGLFEISSIPTIYMICPNRSLKNLGQVDETVIYNTFLDVCMEVSGENNGIISDIASPDEDFCGELTYTPTTVFRNNGSVEVSSVTMSVSVDGSVQETKTISTNLATSEETEISFAEISINDDTQITVTIDAVNGVADDVDDRNEVTIFLRKSEVVANTSTVQVEVTTDQYGMETYWAVRDTEGTVYAEGGDPAIGASGGGMYVNLGGTNEFTLDGNETYTVEVELPTEGCYEFFIADDYGDGMCCQYGDGSYKITDDNGNVVLEGVNEGASETEAYFVNFGVSNVLEVEGLSNLSIKPNPVSDFAEVSFGLTGTTDISVTVYDMLSQRTEVIDADFVRGNNRFGLDVSGYVNGIYFLNLSTAEGSSTVKFTVSK